MHLTVAVDDAGCRRIAHACSAAVMPTSPQVCGPRIFGVVHRDVQSRQAGGAERHRNLLQRVDDRLPVELTELPIETYLAHTERIRVARQSDATVRVRRLLLGRREFVKLAGFFASRYSIKRHRAR